MPRHRARHAALQYGTQGSVGAGAKLSLSSTSSRSSCHALLQSRVSDNTARHVRAAPSAWHMRVDTGIGGISGRKAAQQKCSCHHRLRLRLQHSATSTAGYPA